MKNILYKDKRAQSFFVGLMIMLSVIITIIACMPILKHELGVARDADHLDCTNTSITMWEQATCIVVDFTFLYFFGVAIACAVMYLYWRRTF